MIYEALAALIADPDSAAQVLAQPAELPQVALIHLHEALAPCLEKMPSGNFDTFASTWEEFAAGFIQFCEEDFWSLYRAMKSGSVGASRDFVSRRKELWLSLSEDVAEVRDFTLKLMHSGDRRLALLSSELRKSESEDFAKLDQSVLLFVLCHSVLEVLLVQEAPERFHDMMIWLMMRSKRHASVYWGLSRRLYSLVSKVH
ncbi:MAG: hypothetical protein AB7G54_00475 [Methyloceanibacter sp.]